jgi:enoyl-CoA hydratase/carnithine racemase
LPAPGADATNVVELARDGEVAILRLNRPEKLNAISTEVEGALHEALASDDVRTSGALIVTGEGRAFSAGADISEFEGRSPEDVLRYYHDTGNVYEELAALPLPTVAAIHGYCLGGALELAVALDFRIADDSAVFGFPEVSLGILASSGGLHRVTRLLGPARAKELFLLSERFGPDDARRAGLITEVVEEGKALDRALELAARLAALPRDAVAVTKHAIDATAASPRDAALLIERLAYAALAQTQAARDAAAGFGG